MAYKGEVVGRLRDGTEVRQLTDAELEARGGKERRYCIVGHSHWNPAWFFGKQADDLEREAKLYREAAMMIALHERRAKASVGDA